MYNIFIKVVRVIVLGVVISFAVCIPILQSAYAQETEAEKKIEEGAPETTDPKVTTKSPEENTLYEYEEPVVEETSYAWLIFRTLFVIALLVLGFYLFIRYITKQGAIPLIGGGVLSTLAVMPLGQNKQVQIIELGTQVLVLGVADAQITLLKEVTDRDEIDRIKLQSSRTVPRQGVGFQHFLRGQIEHFVDYVNKSSNKPRTSVKRDIRQHDEAEEVLDNFEEMVVATENDSDSEKRRFFDDERVNYIRKQRSRLREINRYSDED